LKKILFVTGTDTGVGKTVLTALLLAFLRESGGRVLAMKPFCSGGREDALLLHALQDGCLTLDEVNPFYFDRPLAPAAARRRGVSLTRVARKINEAAAQCDLLLVEGVGGLMVPLGHGYCVRDLISALDCSVLVVGANRLGIINHTLLTAESLKILRIKEFTIVLMGVEKPDISVETNAQMIRQSLPKTRIFCLPYLGKKASESEKVKKNVKIVKKVLAEIVRDANLTAFFNRTKR
jgi:dethiobiotin synthetase